MPFPLAIFGHGLIIDVIKIFSCFGFLVFGIAPAVGAALISAAPSILGFIGRLFGGGKGKKTEYQALQTPQAQQMQAALAQYIMSGMQKGATPYGGPLTAASISGNPLNILYSKFLGKGYKKPGLRGYGQYMPQQTPVTPAQRGFRGTVQGPRAFYIEPGMRERVNIQPQRGYQPKTGLQNYAQGYQGQGQLPGYQQIVEQLRGQGGQGQWPGYQQIVEQLRGQGGQGQLKSWPWPGFQKMVGQMGGQQIPTMTPTPPYGRQIIGPGGMNPDLYGGQIPLPTGAIAGGGAIPDWRKTLPPNWQQMIAGAQGRYSPYSTGNIPGAIPFGIPLRM